MINFRGGWFRERSWGRTLIWVLVLVVVGTLSFCQGEKNRDDKETPVAPVATPDQKTSNDSVGLVTGPVSAVTATQSARPNIAKDKPKATGKKRPVEKKIPHVFVEKISQNSQPSNSIGAGQGTTNKRQESLLEGVGQYSPPAPVQNEVVADRKVNEGENHNHRGHRMVFGGGTVVVHQRRNNYEQGVYIDRAPATASYHTPVFHQKAGQVVVVRNKPVGDTSGAGNGSPGGE